MGPVEPGHRPDPGLPTRHSNLGGNRQVRALGCPDLSNGRISVSPYVPASRVYDVASHEYGHARVAYDYGWNLQAADAALGAWFGGGTSAARERAADCWPSHEDRPGRATRHAGTSTGVKVQASCSPESVCLRVAHITRASRRAYVQTAHSTRRNCPPPASTCVVTASSDANRDSRSRSQPAAFSASAWLGQRATTSRSPAKAFMNPHPRASHTESRSQVRRPESGAEGGT